MHRYKFVLYRPLQFLPVLFGISIITFVLVRLDPRRPGARAARHPRDARGDRPHPRAVRPR